MVTTVQVRLAVPPLEALVLKVLGLVMALRAEAAVMAVIHTTLQVTAALDLIRALVVSRDNPNTDSTDSRVATNTGDNRIHRSVDSIHCHLREECPAGRPDPEVMEEDLVVMVLVADQWDTEEDPLSLDITIWVTAI